jgi:hypothetical protein
MATTGGRGLAVLEGLPLFFPKNPAFVPMLLASGPNDNLEFFIGIIIDFWFGNTLYTLLMR